MTVGEKVLKTADVLIISAENISIHGQKPSRKLPNVVLGCRINSLNFPDAVSSPAPALIL